MIVLLSPVLDTFQGTIECKLSVLTSRLKLSSSGVGIPWHKFCSDRMLMTATVKTMVTRSDGQFRRRRRGMGKDTFWSIIVLLAKHFK